MINTRLLIAKRFPGNDELGRACVRVHADVGGKVIKFEEHLAVDEIDRMFDSLFMLGRAHPIRAHVECTLGGSEADSRAAYEAVLEALNQRISRTLH